MELKEIKQLIVVGNGFDLQCGLKSQYEDFFNDIFKIEKIKKEYSLLQMKQKLIEDIQDNPTAQNLNEAFYKCLNGEEKYEKDGKLSTWDIIFLALFICSKEEKPTLLWRDVETAIYFITTWWLIEKPKSNAKWKDDLINGRVDNLYEYEEDFEKYLTEWNRIKEGFDYKNEKIFETIIETVLKEKNEVDILEDLNTFENEFATYINKQTGTEKENQIKEKNYWLNATHLFDKLSAVDSKKRADEKVNIDILNFNYSLDERAISYIKDNVNDPRLFDINSWTNIHGIAAYKDQTAIKKINNLHGVTKQQNFFKLPAPIFGIDNHDIIQKNEDMDDPRIIFTKPFRLMDNHVNIIRSKKFQDDISVITFYGHSLASADYSYFESIFDQYDIFHSNVKLEFYYYRGNSEEEARRNERDVMKKVVKLLTSYGLTLKNEHGENIINKMMLEQRLAIVRSPE